MTTTNVSSGQILPSLVANSGDVINVLSADTVVAIGGKSGTLSELAYSWMYGKPIICCTFAQGWSAEFSTMAIDDRKGSIVLTALSVDEACKHLENLLERED